MTDFIENNNAIPMRFTYVGGPIPEKLPATFFQTKSAEINAICLKIYKKYGLIENQIDDLCAMDEFELTKEMFNDILDEVNKLDLNSIKDDLAGISKYSIKRLQKDGKDILNIFENLNSGEKIVAKYY